MRQTMKVLITGSSGYVGAVLAAHFSRQGIPVIGLDVAMPWSKNLGSSFVHEHCDVRDRAKVGYIFAKHKPTHVLHLAYLMEPQHDTKFEDAVDIDGSLNAFLVAHQTRSVKQFIHFSSASCYGGWPDNPVWITEEQELRPRDWRYAINKKKVENICFGYKKRKDLRLVNFRMCTVVGPSYRKKGSVVSTIAKGLFGLMLDNKDSLVQFIHEDDVNALVERVVRDKKVEGVFNLAPDSFATVRMLNPKNIFLKPSKKLFRSIINLLWMLRLSSVSPTSVNLIAHSIVISPEKLMKRYDYKFKFSTTEAYRHAVKERKRLGTL